MSFYVGQRVRIVGPIASDSPYVGMSATVISPLMLAPSIHDGRFYEVHDLEVDGVGRVGRGGAPIAALPKNLEPLDDSLELASWEALRKIWRPRVTA